MDHRIPLLEESPKPNIHCNLPRNPGNLAPDSNRTIFAPLPNINNNPNQEYNSSPLDIHASVEALLLLNNARVDFEQSTMGSGKENENERNFEIPITAPIPLSYSVRGVEALRSILSVGEDLDEITEPMDLDGEQQSDPQVEFMLAEIPSELPGRPIYHTNTQFCPSADKRQDRVTNQVPVVIRSISPSTLIALTEPCLMAWCLDMPMPMDTVTGSESQQIDIVPTNVPTSSLEYANPSFFIDGYIDTSYMDPTTPNLNLWGY